MVLFIQRLVDGLQSGVLYGSIALALVLVYRATGLLNFATGEIAMLCTFIVWQLAGGGLGLPIVVGIIGGMLFGFAFGAGLERFVIRPFEKADHLRQSMVTMGLFLGINALAGYLFTLDVQRLASPFPVGRWNIGGVIVSYHKVGSIIVLILVAIALRVLFAKTRIGLAMTGAAMNPTSAQLLGVNPSRMLVLGWGLSAALGALVGAMVAPDLFLSTNMMQTLLLYGMAAAVLGGMESYVGALVGGVLIGVIQALAGGYVSFIGTQLQLAVAFAAILIVLLVKPEGLFGKRQVERV
ncbi:branched-chain amino acid ABC transporter permease [Dactylosporangium sp. NPDC000555]|uniref:branched-chain amino acid ABC transporter permease n=1 Tax=unclassified Dactylosporangium TaxID=2621675 RepID=UPI0033213480